MQMNFIFEKYHLPGKFIFCQVMANFADFRRNIYVAMKKKRKKDRRKMLISKYQLLKNFMFQQFVANFA